MAAMDTIDYTSLFVKVGNGADPEVFTHPCLINMERALSFTAEAVATKVPDCTDPTAPKTTKRKVVATDSQISGAGLLPKNAAKEYLDWLLSGEPKNIKAFGAASGELVVSGPYVLTSFNITGEDENECSCSITLDQAGKITTSVAA